MSEEPASRNRKINQVGQLRGFHYPQVAVFGGQFGNGTVFAVKTDGTGFRTLHNFTGPFDNGAINPALITNTDGAFPTGLVLFNNALYGTTAFGGDSANGTVFSISVPQPQLTIVPSGGNVIVTWPTNYSDFTLQFATNLVSPVVWSTNSMSPVVVNGQNTVTNPISGRQQFFRLSQQ